MSVVVNLPVKDENDFAFTKYHRLLTMNNINDGEPAHAQFHSRNAILATAIRASMLK
jgi:hypothetical protein